MKYIPSILLLLVFVFFGKAEAQSNTGNVAQAINETARASGLSTRSIEDILSSFLMWMLGIFGTLAVAALVISGIMYLLAAGNEDMATSAKKNMTYSIIGIVIAMASLIIVRALDAVLRGATFF